MFEEEEVQEHKLTASDEEIRAGLEKELRQGADWYFWIAGLSLVNTGIAVFGGDWNFVLGLAVTMIVDAVAGEAGMAGSALPVGINLLVAGMFVFFGMQARKKKRWPFLVGMPLYLLDGLLFVLFQVWLAVAIHGLALYYLYKGLAALNQLLKLERTVAPGLSEVKLD